jgi:hypothetical protein
VKRILLALGFLAITAAAGAQTVTVRNYYGAADTAVSLVAGQGSLLPDPGFYVYWWDSTLYLQPTGDPKAEIVLVYVKDGDLLTVVRGQMGTTASTKNAANDVYKMRVIMPFTPTRTPTPVFTPTPTRTVTQTPTVTPTPFPPVLPVAVKTPADSAGNVLVSFEGHKTTYSACLTQAAPPDVNADCWCINNPLGEKLMKVVAFVVTGQAGDTENQDFVLVRRSTLDTYDPFGPAPVTLSDIPQDSSDAAGTGLVRQFVAVPTPGVFVGNVWAGTMVLTSDLFASNGSVVNVVELGGPGAQPQVLRIHEGLCLQLLNSLASGTKLDVTAYWTEETP